MFLGHFPPQINEGMRLFIYHFWRKCTLESNRYQDKIANKLQFPMYKYNININLPQNANRSPWKRTNRPGLRNYPIDYWVTVHGSSLDWRLSQRKSSRLCRSRRPVLVPTNNSYFLMNNLTTSPVAQNNIMSMLKLARIKLLYIGKGRYSAENHSEEHDRFRCLNHRYELDSRAQ